MRSAFSQIQCSIIVDRIFVNNVKDSYGLKLWLEDQMALKFGQSNGSALANDFKWEALLKDGVDYCGYCFRDSITRVLEEFIILISPGQDKRPLLSYLSACSTSASLIRAPRDTGSSDEWMERLFLWVCQLLIVFF